ncbi:hypothetical protein GIB67_015307 [Kingdonia uniflora]|uniref:Uncharacterized protein n=1 Tax=Kingdonia uniflora TaxID=39325 RepID=A0A7J7KYU2_9MAGN|nr:hypothetical protein GIB67_015307 [Kingdonia uniflora]
MPASGATVSCEVAQGKRRRVEPLGGSGEKVAEVQSVSVDNLKEFEERAKLAILQGKEDTSQMVARLVKGIWLGIEEQKSELKKAKSELEKNLARAKTDTLKEVKQLKVAHTIAINQLQVEAKANLDEMAEEHDRLGHYLMLMGYSQEEVDAVKADTYAEEEEEEAGLLGVVDGLDGVSPQTVLDNQGDDVELNEDGSEKVVKETSLRINDLKSGLATEIETSKALLSVQVEEKDFGIKKGLEDLFEATKRAENLQRQVDALAKKGKQADMAQYRIQGLERTEELCQSDLNSCRIELERMRQKFIGKDDECDGLNERVAQLKAERDHTIARAKKVRAREGSEGSRNVNKAPLVQWDVVSLSDRIRELEDLRECQHKLDATLIREKVLEGEIRAKDSLLKINDDLLKDLPAKEELEAKLWMFRAQVVELQATNLAESKQYISKFKEYIIRHDKIDEDRNAWKDTYDTVKERYGRLKARFAKAVIHDVSRSDLLMVIVAYFVEEVKRLELKRDTLLKTLSDKGCTCGAEIDRGNCLSVMETQLGP